MSTSTAKNEDLPSPQLAEKHEGVLAEETVDAGERKATNLKIDTDSSGDDDV